MLLTHWTPEKVRTSLSAVTVKELKHWTAENLGTTLTSKRTTAYQEATPNTGQPKNLTKNIYNRSGSGQVRSCEYETFANRRKATIQIFINNPHLSKHHPPPFLSPLPLGEGEGEGVSGTRSYME